MTDGVDRTQSPPVRVLVVDPRLTTPGYLFSLTETLAQQPGLGLDLAWSPSPGRTFDASPDLALFPETMRTANRFHLPGRLVNRLCRRRYGKEVDRITEFAEKNGNDLVHFNWSFDPSLEMKAVERLRKLGIPVIYTAHNAVPHNRTAPTEAAVEFCRSVDHIVTLTDYVRERIMTDTGLATDRFTVIPHGDFSPGVFPGIDSEDSTPPRSGPPTVTYLGKIRPYKGVPDLIDAWPAVLDQVPDARLVVAGRLYLSARFEVTRALKRVGAARDTIHTDFSFLPADRYEGLLRSATLIVQPYRSASQSGNTAHAYRRGIPVVCTRVGGLPEMVGEGQTGAIADPGDGKSLTDAIVRTLRANQNGELADSCRRFHHSHFSWETIGRSHLQLYRALKNPGRLRP